MAVAVLVVVLWGSLAVFTYPFFVELFFLKDLAKGKFTYKNPYLEEVLESYNKNNKTTWKSILVKGGSVQHLDFLTDEEKSKALKRKDS